MAKLTHILDPTKAGDHLLYQRVSRVVLDYAGERSMIDLIAGKAIQNLSVAISMKSL